MWLGDRPPSKANWDQYHPGRADAGLSPVENMPGGYDGGRSTVARQPRTWGAYSRHFPTDDDIRRRTPMDADDVPRSGQLFLTIRPLLVVLQVLGCLPVSLKDDRLTPCFSATALKREPSLLVLAAYTVLANAVIVGCTTMQVYEMSTGLAEQRSPTQDVVLHYGFLLASALDFVVPLRFWVRCSRIRDYFGRWKELEGEFARMSPAALVPLRRRQFARGVVAAIGSSVVVIAWQMGYDNLRFGAFFAASRVMHFGDVLLWWCLCSALMNSAEQVTRGLEVAVRGSGDRRRPRSALIDHYSNAWRLLNDLLMDTGNFLSFNFILEIVMCSAKVVIEVYYGLAIVKGAWKLAQLLSFALLNILSLFFMLNTAHQASAKVNYVFKRKLLYMLVEERNELCKEQLLKFIQVVSAGSSSISLGGFFTCDRGMLTDLFNAALTYLVVMLQLQGPAA